MKRKYLTYAGILPVVTLGIIGAGVASAHGGWFGGGINKATPEEISSRFNTMFQKEADLLGISVEDVKNAWASGKTLSDLAKEKGISLQDLQNRMKEAAKANMKTEIQALVDRGIITQAQADARLKFMETKVDSHMMKGFGMHGLGLRL